jgi:hypothetical protein
MHIYIYIHTYTSLDVSAYKYIYIYIYIRKHHKLGAEAERVIVFATCRLPDEGSAGAHIKQVALRACWIAREHAQAYIALRVHTNLYMYIYIYISAVWGSEFSLEDPLAKKCVCEAKLRGCGWHVSSGGG